MGCVTALQWDWAKLYCRQRNTKEHLCHICTLADWTVYEDQEARNLRVKSVNFLRMKKMHNGWCLVFGVCQTAGGITSIVLLAASIEGDTLQMTWWWWLWCHDSGGADDCHHDDCSDGCGWGVEGDESSLMTILVMEMGVVVMVTYSWVLMVMMKGIARGNTDQSYNFLTHFYSKTHIWIEIVRTTAWTIIGCLLDKALRSIKKERKIKTRENHAAIQIQTYVLMSWFRWRVSWFMMIGLVETPWLGCAAKCK